MKCNKSAHTIFSDIIYKTRCLDVPFGATMTHQSAVDMTVAQCIYHKMDEIDDRVKVVEAKVSDGVSVLCAKIAENWTLTDVRFTGLETGQASIYGEVTDVKNGVARVEDDVVNIANDVAYVHGEVYTLRGEVATVGDEVARLAYMVDERAKKQVIMLGIIIIMLGIIIIMLGYNTYVGSLPVTVCPHHTEPVDECKNATNTIIGGLRCLTDKMLPKPCRNGFACKRETYPDW